jgi:hypothetical protein
MRKQEQYRTATATIGCYLFKKDAHVAVQFAFRSMGMDWYKVSATREGLEGELLNSYTYYPEGLLTGFVL